MQGQVVAGRTAQIVPYSVRQGLKGLCRQVAKAHIHYGRNALRATLHMEPGPLVEDAVVWANQHGLVRVAFDLRLVPQAWAFGNALSCASP